MQSGDTTLDGGDLLNDQQHRFRLYVTGVSPNSVRAITNIKALCEKYYKGNYVLEVVDVYQQPGIAKEEQIIALPLLVKKFPLPEKRLIGDLSDTQKVLKILNLI